MSSVQSTPITLCFGRCCWSVASACLSFFFDRYVGTNKPKNYSSDVRVLDADGKELPKEESTPPPNHWRDFVDCVKSRKRPRADLASVAQTTIVCHGGRPNSTLAILHAASVTIPMMKPLKNRPR